MYTGMALQRADALSMQHTEVLGAAREMHRRLSDVRLALRSGIEMLKLPVLQAPKELIRSPLGAH